LVITVKVVGSKPPLNVTLAPLIPVPLESFTVPLIIPAVEMLKLSVVFVPGLTVAVWLNGSQPVLATVTLYVPAAREEST
jgi:hypothetical protein